MIAVSSQSLAPAIGTAALVLAWIWPFAGGPSPATLPWLVSAACLSVWVLVALWQRVDVAHCAARAWLISALLSSAIGLLQFFGVSGSFKPWVNVTGLGDAFGNLRQRNQFATLTMVGLAVVMLGPLAGRRPATPPVSGASRRGHAGVHFAVAAGSTVWPGLLAAALLAEASLSFLGLGVQPPHPSWGAMLARAYQAMDIAPEQMYPPGLAILFTALAFNALGESLRIALDPTLKR